MNRQTNVRWNLIVLLAVLGLVRPLLSISGVYDSLGGGPWASVFVTIMIAAVWVGAVVATRFPSPLATLAFAGSLYGVFAIVLQQMIRNLVLGGLPGSVGKSGQESVRCPARSGRSPHLSARVRWGLMSLGVQCFSLPLYLYR
jgi:hypothetical protein